MPALSGLSAKRQQRESRERAEMDDDYSAIVLSVREGVMKDAVQQAAGTLGLKASPLLEERGDIVG